MAKALLEKAHTHAAEGHALVFAILLYDERTPGTRKALRDRDYVDALHRVSGDRVVVFIIRDGISRSSKKDVNQDSYTPSAASLNQSFSGLLLELCKQRIDLRYPALLIFQVQNMEVSEFLIAEMGGGETAEEFFLKAKKYVERLTYAVSAVSPENFENGQEIFALAEGEIESLQWEIRILKLGGLLRPIISALRKGIT
ncbi:MAG TPA: hypothetical protein VM118_00045 [Acidobacteriota bacterium]|nr:hypothetical protein [Acidobacteriota bacterium]